jgi:N-methylhydantoinase B
MVQPFAIDSITASVVQGALENIAVEMGYKLMRMSYSSIIRESEDFGAALVDADGRGLAESAQSTPLQSGPIPGYIRGILKALRARGDAVRRGDVIMHNDAYGGASHGPDVAFAVPVFHERRLVAFAATTAHHLDIGALSPGSCGIVDAIDAYAEGLQFKATPGHGKQTLAALLDGLIAPGLRSPRKQEIGGHGSCPATVGRIQSERRVSVERIGTALIEAAAMRCGPGGDASRAAFRRPCSVKPGGDTAHDYGASTAEWCTVRPGD